MISHIPPLSSTNLTTPKQRYGLIIAAALIGTALVGCVNTPLEQRPASGGTPVSPPPQVKTVTTQKTERVDIEALPTLSDADLVAAWPAWQQSCRSLTRRPQAAVWRAACDASAAVKPTDAAAVRSYWRQQFDVWRVLIETREDNGGNAAEARVLSLADQGRITGYYEPLLNGSRQRSARFNVPLYRVPDDLLVVDMSSLYPELAGKRLRGRIVEPATGTGPRRVVPYWTRAEIDEARLQGQELLWVEDPIEAFFLQVQGSGRVQLVQESNQQVRVAYADTNGHPYRSIGRWLMDQGELTFEQASMAGIQTWARNNPQRLKELLHQNPSMVFFKDLPVGDPTVGPVGALNVPLTPHYSIAVDPQFVALGMPLVISTQHPTSGAPIKRLVVAQDTGGAIRGPLRFDLFWGFGREAGEHAGRQRHDVQAWLLVPKGLTPEALLNTKR